MPPYKTLDKLFPPVQSRIHEKGQAPKAGADHLLGCKRMRTDLYQRNEMYRARFLKGIAILLSSLPWVFIVTVVQFWSQIDDHAPLFIIAAVVSLFFSSFAILLFIRSRGDSDATRSDALRIMWAALPIILIPLIACWYVIYGLAYFSTHVGSMHDSM